MRNNPKFPKVYSLYPLIVEDIVLFIDKLGKIPDKNIFKAITNGYNISMNEHYDSYEDDSEDKFI